MEDLEEEVLEKLIPPQPARTPGKKRTSEEAEVGLEEEVSNLNLGGGGGEGGENETPNVGKSRSANNKTPLKSCFKSPTKVFSAKVASHSTSPSDSEGLPSSSSSSSYDPTPRQRRDPLHESLHGVQVWKGKGLNPRVKNKMEEWKQRYARPVEDEERDGEVGDDGEGGEERKLLVKAGMEVRGGWGKWPKVSFDWGRCDDDINSLPF